MLHLPQTLQARLPMFGFLMEFGQKTGAFSHPTVPQLLQRTNLLLQADPLLVVVLHSVAMLLLL